MWDNIKTFGLTCALSQVLGCYSLCNRHYDRCVEWSEERTTTKDELASYLAVCEADLQKCIAGPMDATVLPAQDSGMSTDSGHADVQTSTMSDVDADVSGEDADVDDSGISCRTQYSECTAKAEELPQPEIQPAYDARFLDFQACVGQPSDM